MRKKLNASVLVFLALCTATLSFAVSPKELFKPVTLSERWSKKTLKLNKTLVFNKTSGSGTSIDKTTISFFSGATCSGTALGTYTTPNGGNTLSISNNTPFGLTTRAAYEVGSDADKANISDMTAVGSIAVVLRSSETDVPQGNFTGSTCGDNPSFCCVAVDCTSGSTCVETGGSIGDQDFTLKASGEEAPGDPADGGVIACLNVGNRLVATRSDDSTSIIWGGTGITTGATSTIDGSSNTATITAALGGGLYAASLCEDHTENGGYTSGWFLPAGNNTTTTGQLNCLYVNRVAITGFSTDTYWSSTENTSTTAWYQSFNSGSQGGNGSKHSSSYVRCVRALG